MKLLSTFSSSSRRRDWIPRAEGGTAPRLDRSGHGHRVVRLTGEAGSSTLYFHDNAFSAAGDADVTRRTASRWATSPRSARGARLDDDRAAGARRLFRPTQAGDLFDGGGGNSGGGRGGLAHRGQRRHGTDRVRSHTRAGSSMPTRRSRSSRTARRRSGRQLPAPAGPGVRAAAAADVSRQADGRPDPRSAVLGDQRRRARPARAQSRACSRSCSRTSRPASRARPASSTAI